MTIAQSQTDALVEEFHSWLEENWDPDLTVEEWWERLGLSGWAAPTFPENAYGKGLSRPEAARLSQEFGKVGALGPPAGLGMLLAGPTIATHGTQEQIDLYVRDIVTGKKAWCQLFSEPGAGSDLAGLSTKAVKQDDEFIINGQKVWTSGGQTADMGMLLARTDPTVPKHQGISWFAFDMDQPGVDVRPLREMTGHALFSEVFISDACVPESAIIGGINNGWAAANTTLAFERAGLGAGGGGAAAGAMGLAGSKAGMLERRAGDLVRPATEGGGGRGGRRGRGRMSSATLLVGLAKGNGMWDNPVVRQKLAHLHILGEIGRFNTERAKAQRASGGGDIPGIGNISKLLMSDIVRLSRDIGMQIVGAQGLLAAQTPEEQKVIDEATGNPFLGGVIASALMAQAPPIYGGTDQIQMNVIGERVLGLPKDIRDDHIKPFNEVPKNQ